jgi:hypothetical protein
VKLGHLRRRDVDGELGRSRPDLASKARSEGTMKIRRARPDGAAKILEVGAPLEAVRYRKDLGSAGTPSR